MAVSKISLSELKKELIHLPAKELIEICINLAKLKRENKDYLNYTLFNANDIDGFIIEAKLEIDAQFRDSAFIYTYAVKKTLRKILKYANYQIKFAKNKKVDIELLIQYCINMKEHLLLNHHPVVDNIFMAQLKKIEKAQTLLHEDLQYDYKKQIEELLEAVV